MRRTAGRSAAACGGPGPLGGGNATRRGRALTTSGAVTAAITRCRSPATRGRCEARGRGSALTTGGGIAVARL